MFSSRKHWMITICLGTLAVVLLFGVSHLLFMLDLISPLPRNGINKVHVTCDGLAGEISTQRYYGFEDFLLETPKEFADLPIRSQLRCAEASVRLERRADLRDRFVSAVYCDGATINISDQEDLFCPGIILVEVRRV